MSSDGINEELGCLFADFLSCVQEGRLDDAERLCVAHPEHEQELRGLAQNMQSVDAWECDQSQEVLPTVNGFEVLELLGIGGQGHVFKALQESTNRVVALKLIRGGSLASGVEQRRLQSEVALASKLTHPNIVSIYESGRDKNQYYFAMEYIDGVSLDVYAIGSEASIDGLVLLFVQVCEAVAHAHRRGVLHRDLKPSNILVDNGGVPHICDFGLAKSIISEIPAKDGITEPGGFAGTWYYASPEQARLDSSLVDIRSDVYALGVILYELLTGQYPYPIEGEHREAVARHIIETPIAALSSHRGDIPSDVKTIVLMALSKDPDRRYQSADALADDLRRYLVGQAIQAKRDSTWYVLRKSVGRHRAALAIVVAALMGIVTFSVVVSVFYVKALDAKATTDVTVEFALHEGRYQEALLDDTLFAANQLRAIAAAHPQLAELRMIRRTVVPFQDSPFAAWAGQVPEDLLDVILGRRDREAARAIQWLDDHETQLRQTTAYLAEHRLLFSTSSPVSERRTEAIGRSRPTALERIPRFASEARVVARALLARALLYSLEDRDGEALNDLNTARMIALDLGDGPAVLFVSQSLLTREDVYNCVLAIFASITHPDRLRAYAEWVSSDPPLPLYRGVLYSDRRKLTETCLQYLFGVAKNAAGQEGGGGRSATLDVSGMDDRHGVFSGSKVDMAETRQLAREVTPMSVLLVIDEFYEELALWDDLPLADFQDRAERLYGERSGDDAWNLLLPLFPDRRPGYRRRLRILTLRTGTILAARVQAYRVTEGDWPRSLDEVIEGRETLAIDPSAKRPFVYGLRGGWPFLHSADNPDVEEQTRAGAKGDAGAGIVFIGPRRSSP